MLGTPPPAVIELAVQAAICSSCQRSKRGAVLFSPPEKILGTTFNGPPTGYACDGSPECRADCGKTCMHAEERLMLWRPRTNLTRCHVLHAKAVEGQLVPSGPPSCWQCSRTMADLRVGFIWLFHETGWRAYTAKEFHDLTLKHCGLYPFEVGKNE